MRLSPLRRFVLVVVLLGLLTSITSAMGRPVLAATTTTLPLAAMPMISRNVPAYATNAVLPASNGNAADYGLAYRGTLPTSLSYDLSGVAAAQRTKLLVSWSNDGNIWYPPMISAAYANNPRDYTLDANAAAGGGSPPATGWVNLVTMTGNAYNGRQHAVDFTGYSWLRMQVTAVNGSAGNTDASFKLDAYDASAGTADTWTFFGDSITQSDMKHADPAYADGLHNFAQLVNAAHPPNFPSFLDGGISGKLASSMLQTDPATGTVYWTEFLAATASRFVSIDFGTNDANQGVAPSTFRSQMQQLISAAETAGKVPVIRLIPWGCSSGIQSNAPLLNQQIQALWAADSQIIHGPDLWTYFSQHQNLISSDCIHPTLPDGALAYRQQYEQTMLAAVYSALQVTGLQTGNVGPSSALINWQTNNGANSRVDYGTTTGYGLSVSDGSSLTAHSVTLPTLNSNTTYHYKSTSLDGFGQTATSADATFTTTSGWGWARGVGGADAAISGGSYTLSVTAPAAGNFLALSSVLVDVNKAGTPSIASVRDNGSPASSWARAVANTDGGLHDSGEIWYAANVTGRPTQITVTVNLAGSSNPHQASRVDEYAGIATSAPLDQTAIRTNNNVAVSPTGTTGATGVDQELAIALYGDNNQGLTITSPAGWTERRNSVGRSGAGEAVIDKAVPLGPQTASFSTNGNTWAVAAIATFKIATGPPPVLQVSGAQATNLTATSAQIGWQTNSPANSRVDYGLTSAYGSSTSDAPTLADWPTYHLDQSRTANDTTEGMTATVSSAWNTTVTGQVYAEPLVVGNTVLIATEQNNVYGLDATSGAILWSNTTLGAPVPQTSLPCGNINPVGITSTPVVDKASGLMYVVATLASPSIHYELYAISISNGAISWHETIAPANFNVIYQGQRGALALANGRVYIPFGGRSGDCGTYSGWVVAALASGPGSLLSFALPNGPHMGGIWAPGGSSVDASGNIFVATGNTSCGANCNPFDYGESVIKLSPTLGLTDYWAPTNYAPLNASDTDMGSLEPAQLPGNLVFQVGKAGDGYLLNAATLGGISNAPFSAHVCPGLTADAAFGGTAYAAPYIYAPCNNGLVALNVNLSAPSFAFAWKGPAVSFAGAPIVAGGVVWTIDPAGTLYGLDPATGTQRFNVAIGGANHFATPSAAGGRLFVPAGQVVRAYSLTPGPGVTTHAMTLTTLAPTTTYHYMVTSVDGAGQTASSADATFTTSAPLAVSGAQVGSVTASSAVISWQTNTAANSRADYGTTTAYGLSASDGTSVTAHSLTLSNLTGSTSYHTMVTSADGAGQTASSADLSFTTSAPPPGWAWVRGVGGADAAISGGSYTLSVTAPAAGNFLALSSVLVDVSKAGTPSIASVRDNGSPASSWARAVANTDGGLHDSGEIWYATNVTGRPTQITVTVNLAGSSNPHQASRVDEYAGIVTSAPLDQTAIRTNNNVAVSPTGTTGATGVDQELAIALYGDNNQGLTITSPAGWTERRNSVGRSGAGEAVIDKAVPLGPQTASFSTNGNTWAVAAIATFKIATGPPPPPPPLQVTGVQTGNVGPTSAVISWQTNNPANSRVDYGLTTTYGQFVSDGTSVIAHSLTLSNLTTLTTYHYMVTSVDGAGQTASSADGTFTTISTPRGWAWAQGASGADAAVSGGSYTLSIAAPAAGNFLALSSVLVDVNKVGTPTIASVRDNGSPASTWARAVANTDGGLHDSAEIWYATNVTGRPTQITVTVNVSGSTNLHQASRADEYSGIAGSAPLDQTAIHSDYNVAVSPTGTTAATAADQELAIALYGDNNQGLTITSPYGWTERRNSLGRYGAGEVVIDRAVPIGPQTASFSTNGYTWAVTAIATFKLQP